MRCKCRTIFGFKGKPEGVDPTGCPIHDLTLAQMEKLGDYPLDTVNGLMLLLSTKWGIIPKERSAMPTAIEVAKYFLSRVDDESGDSISNLKLQKLLYYAQGFHLAAFGAPLFPGRIEAWAHGPVVPDVYHNLKQFGATPIILEQDVDFESAIEPRSRELLDEVYSVYGQFSATSLRNMSHDEPPWKQTPQGAVITHDLMRDFSKTRITIED